MATVSFWGGVGITGSSKVLIEDRGWRILLDVGLDRPQTELYHHPVRPRQGMELHDRLKVGDAPWIPRLFQGDVVLGTGLEGGSDGKTAVFISHSHVDHIGLVGWIDPRIPIYAAPETVKIREAITTLGRAAQADSSFELIFAEKVMLEGQEPQIRPMNEADPLEFGPFVVTRYRVDHDVPGASGYIVETSEGRVAYTGDIRLHGRHPEWVTTFAKQAAQSDVFVIEGTTLGRKSRDTEDPVTEEQVDKNFTNIVEHTRGLILISLRPRNIERIESFTRIAKTYGRKILWSKEFATFLGAYGLEVQRIDYSAEQLQTIRRSPEKYVIQMGPKDIPWLMDLPVGPDSLFIHSDGDPKLTSQAGQSLRVWLQRYHVGLRTLGTRGHGTPEAIHQIVEWVTPKVVYPVHTHSPELLQPDPPTMRVVPEYARRYPIR
ncbi:MAG: MBL fold metallo-hydrolase [Firmicutes bacterium]|jgi:ribonuclease J|uniref:Metallo-beta-lactamase domain-containing protein n=1 Tax=Sulfobacillus benefaciens TaxID=453960 RepID=A0A2T2WUT5_9FIRM|nr:MBL fold metallo-hydrolase [Bacillota bacterium]MCL5014610.1 MBL fold metallo-hydrolase [Bacillota bacterium]PSR26007.1 MAG: hypothetical protein C7B43_15175 [Sulfobacillus benefaciens]